MLYCIQKHNTYAYTYVTLKYNNTLYRNLGVDVIVQHRYVINMYKNDI